MNDRPKIMNQTEAAEYINESGIPMNSPRLSNLTNSGGGPEFEPKGNQKLFMKEDVDAWIDAEQKRLDELDERSRPTA